MATVVVCSRGELNASVWVTLPTRIEIFNSDNPPITIESGEGITPKQGTLTVEVTTTGYSQTMRTIRIWLPVQRIFSETTRSAAFSTPSTRWFVLDAFGKKEGLFPVAGGSPSMWGAAVRYEVLAEDIEGEPYTIYTLAIRDAAGQERSWSSTTGAIPWEHKCGCKAGELSCGDCCLDCSRTAQRLNGVGRNLDGALAKTDALLRRIDSFSS